MQIWLVRHASTSAQEEGRLQGQMDFPLSNRGKKEAGKLAARLKAVSYTHLDVYKRQPVLRSR